MPLVIMQHDRKPLSMLRDRRALRLIYTKIGHQINLAASTSKFKPLEAAPRRVPVQVDTKPQALRWVLCESFLR